MLARAVRLAPALVLLATAPRARAYEERLSLEVGAGPRLLLAPSLEPAAGAAFGITAGRGQVLSLAADVRYGFVGGVAPVHALSGSFGLVFVLDIVTVVPRFEFGVGPAALVRPDAAFAVTGHAAIGFDVLVDSRAADLFGLDLRCDVLAPVSPSDDPLVTIGLVARVGWLVERY